jgi:predicted adenine nucleotide alpha hydrolase (AANH) superfamily ATPase
VKILVHACCGPCSIRPLAKLKEEGARAAVLFFNPNIHPYTEWERRRAVVAEHCGREEVTLLPVPDYDARPWMRRVAFRETERCRLCFHLRLTEAARFARRGRFDAFTTTLLYSRYQNHGLVREVGEEVAREYDVPFLYRDWRGEWQAGVEESKRLGMYRQEYCGCLLSEEERYRPLRKKPGPTGGGEA